MQKTQNNNDLVLLLTTKLTDW